MASKEELTRTCNKQSRQLSETKQKTKQMQNKESQMVEQLTKNIDTLQREAEEVKEKNQKVGVEQATFHYIDLLHTFMYFSAVICL